VTRTAAKSLVMGFVVLVTAAVLGMMAFVPAEGGHAGMTGDHDMGAMTMDDPAMTGR
jgi:hypothetical protein